jgi:hypothetical protein
MGITLFSPVDGSQFPDSLRMFAFSFLGKDQPSLFSFHGSLFDFFELVNKMKA